VSIYTKKGDRGESTLFDPCLTKNKRVKKNHPRLRAIGVIDELNSYLGVVISTSEDQGLQTFLKTIQRNLFIINSLLAGAKLSFPKSKTLSLEKKIDEINQNIPPLKNFILPGGSQTASHLQYARTICRRAERHLVTLSQKEKLPPEILRYFNRLSDCLFTLAREQNFKLGIPEEPWKIR
jgi:cob(I)alamin adenosyltransferase